MAKPQWATPERLAILAEISERHGNQCLQGHDVCPEPEHYLKWEAKTVTVPVPVKYGWKDPKTDLPRRDKFRLGWDSKRVTVYEPQYKVYRADHLIEGLIDHWKADDRERANFEWKLEERRVHHGERGRFGQRFDPVEREVYKTNRPEYYLVGVGVDPRTFRRVAMIRIPSGYHHLFVDVDAVQISKSKRRKMRRYGATVPDELHQLCLAATREWWRVNPRS